MTFLFEADLAYLRANRLTSLTQRGTIQRNVSTDDGAGGSTSSWQAIATNVPCRATAQRPQEVEIAGKVTSVVRWLINLPPNQDVTPHDRIGIGGRTFEVNALIASIGVVVGNQVLATEVV